MRLLTVNMLVLTLVSNLSPNVKRGQYLSHVSVEVRLFSEKEKEVEEVVNTEKAILSSYDEYTTFTYKDRTITFLTGNNLMEYTKVKEWDKGYLVVMCRTKMEPEHEQEDYIDLIPILNNLYIEPERFLKPIKEVEISYV